MTEKLLVTTSIGKASRTEVWDSTQPLGIGHPFRWVLERTETGVRVREIGAAPGGSHRGAFTTVTPEAIATGSSVPLPSVDRSAGEISSLRIRHLRYLHAPFARKESTVSVYERMNPKLYVYTGVRRLLSGSQEIHSAYVAYSRSKPVFTVYRTKEGFQVKPLLSGVNLKVRGQSATPGITGEAWNLSEADLYNATFTRGYHWWRFAKVNAIDPAQIDRGPLSKGDRDEARRVLGIIRTMVMAIAAISVAVFLAPPFKRELRDVPVPPQVVKVPLRHRFIQPLPTPASIVPPLETYRPKAKPEPTLAPLPRQVPPRLVEPKPVHTVKPLEAVKPKPSARPASQARAGEGAPSKATDKRITSEPPKGTLNGTVKNLAIVPQSTRPTEKTAQELAAEQTRAVREALSGASVLTETKAAVAENPNDSGASGDVFRSQGKGMAETKIKGGYVPGDTKVSGLGGGGYGSSRDGKGVGYGGGVKGMSSGKTGGFVSLDSGGSTVDEGLSKEEVGAVIHSHMSEIRYCHESSLLIHPKNEGKVIVDFTINPKGVVAKAAVQSSSVPEHSLDKCVMERLRKWRFPKPKGGVNVAVSYPFLFKLLGME